MSDLRGADSFVPWPRPSPRGLVRRLVLPEGETFISIATAGMHSVLVLTTRGYRMVEPDWRVHPIFGPLWKPPL